MSKMQSSHYTNFGASIAPREADNEGFLSYREGFEALHESEWTEAESWVFYAVEAINGWRNGQ